MGLRFLAFAVALAPFAAAYGTPAKFPTSKEVLDVRSVTTAAEATTMASGSPILEAELAYAVARRVFNAPAPDPVAVELAQSLPFNSSTLVVALLRAAKLRVQSPGSSVDWAALYNEVGPIARSVYAALHHGARHPEIETRFRAEGYKLGGLHNIFFASLRQEPAGADALKIAFWLERATRSEIQPAFAATRLTEIGGPAVRTAVLGALASLGENGMSTTRGRLASAALLTLCDLWPSELANVDWDYMAGVGVPAYRIKDLQVCSRTTRHRFARSMGTVLFHWTNSIRPPHHIP